MKTYKFLVTEVLQGVLEVEANSASEAADQAQQIYEADEDGAEESFTLYYEDCTDSSIKLIRKNTKLTPAFKARYNL